MVHKAVRVDTRETEEDDGEGVKVLSAIFAFFPLIFLQRCRSALVVTGRRVLLDYLKRRIHFFPSSLPGFFILFLLLFSFFPPSSPSFHGPSGQTDAVCTWQGKALIFLEGEPCWSNPAHHLRRTYSLPLLPWERFSSSPLQEGGKKRRETGEDSLEGGERGRLVGTSRMLKFRPGSAPPLWSH